MYASKTALARLSVLAFGVLALGCGKDLPSPTNAKTVSNDQPQATVIEIPPRPHSPERKVALEKAREIWLRGPLVDRGFPFGMDHLWTRGYARSNSFSHQLRRAGGFGKVSVASGDHYPKWVKLQLNTDGAGFDAIYFSSGDDNPLDLIWAFAVAGNPRM